MKAENDYEPSQEEIEKSIESAEDQMREFCKERGIRFEERVGQSEEEDALAAMKKEGWEDIETVANAASVSVDEKTPTDYEYTILPLEKSNTFKVLRRKKEGVKRTGGIQKNR